MEVLSKRWVIIGVLVIIGMLYVFDGGITGEVVWEPVTVVDNCSEGDIRNLWNEIFVENDTGIVIYNESGVDCNAFIAIKGNGVDEVWYMFYSFSSPGFISIDYVNVTVGLYADIFAASSFAELTNHRLALLLRFDEINNYTFSDAAAALSYFNSKFKISPNSLSYNIDSLPVYFSNEVSSDADWEYNITYNVFENKSFVGIFNEFTSIDGGIPVTAPVFTDNISNFIFERNSSWNYALDIDNYFDNNVGLVAEFSSVGGNNSGGEWINFTIEDNGDVSFKPATGFLGFRKFVLVVRNPSGVDALSNAFNVTIVEKVNHPPKLIEDISFIDVPRSGSVKLHMDAYFEDDDGDDMTYRAGGEVETLDINITGDEVVFRLKDTFNESVKVYIYANDGEAETKSDVFWVFEEGVNNNVPGNESDENAQNDTDDENDTTTGDTSGGNISGVDSQSADVDGDEDGGFGWILWTVVGLVVVGLVLFSIWFFILRKGERVGGSINSPLSTVPGGGEIPTVPTPNGQRVPNVKIPVAAAQYQRGKPTTVKTYVRSLNLPKK